MCEIYEYCFSTRDTPPKFKCQKIYDMFFFLMRHSRPKFVCDMQETFLKTSRLNTVWKPRDVFLVDGISRLKCLYGQMLTLSN